MNDKIKKSLLKYITVFLITFAVLAGTLFGVAKLPKSLVQKNISESAEYLCEKSVFWNVFEAVDSSRIDRYADAILLAISYQYDDTYPMESVMWSSYYYTKYQNENENLRDAVTQGYTANHQYLRYWHGSNAILRPLLVVFNIQEIYILHGILLIVLLGILLKILLRNQAIAPCVGLVLGFVATSAWFVPLSLEYTWTYLLMLIASIIGIKLVLGDKYEHLDVLFLISGMLTNYMDFLTTETLTLLVPLLLILWMQRHRHVWTTWKKFFCFAFKSVVLWGIGYIGMWVMKWILASIVLKQNVMPYVSGHIEERIGGSLGISLWSYLTGAVTRNIRSLFPFEYGLIGRIAGISVLMCMAYIAYVYHKHSICWKMVLLYGMLACIPYIRYLVLHNHSYTHYFFTYRAQVAVVLALIFILDEVTEWRWLIRGVT